MEETCPAPVCGSHVYVVGCLRAHPPDMGVARELETEAHALGSPAPTLSAVLADHPHLARAMVWVLEIAGVPAYVLEPCDCAARDDLVEAVADPGSEGEEAMFVAVGDLAGTRQVAGVTLPALRMQHAYLLDRAGRLALLATDPPLAAGQANVLIDHTRQMTHNLGREPEHRALNYVIVRLQDLYHVLARLQPTTLGVETHRSRLAQAGSTIIDVVFNLGGGVAEQDRRWFVRVHVDDLYPYALEPHLQRWYER